MNHNTWQNGYWQHAHIVHSPNCCPRPPDTAISLIVLHNISLPPFEYGTGAIAQLFTNTLNPQAHPFFSQLQGLEVSSHFLIERTGQVIQFVSCDEMAYHAGQSAFHGREKCNTYSIGIEIEGCDFEPFAPQQYTVLQHLLQALMAHYPIEAITGHQHIAPMRKSDPGHFFDWDRLIQQNFPIDFNLPKTQ